ncbi:MAG: hypothetical protein Solumvirus2_35 [Solumvirus sp.]|uniref:G-protein coupled receptors family 1 profile domain-containing protein n=1 Tax=Solumvirus sp. TaxID=2487773 RepID=A0A3G5AGG7_9VIRU|nr:MAG: hypothetical protein Solumvirus2_35 [Solumvirus sp.]
MNETLDKSSNLEINNNEWNIGTLNKTAIWSYYVAANYIGVVMCILLMITIYRNKKKLSVDIFIMGLCSGCLWMSITCGSQCLASVISQYFFGGYINCQLEAFFHVSAILVQFFCVSLIAIRNYVNIVKRSEISLNTSILIVILIWIKCIIVTVALSKVSSIYLMTAGTYCFFGFSSPAIAYWLLPGLVLSVLTMTYCYGAIIHHVKNISYLSTSSKIESGNIPKSLDPGPKSSRVLDTPASIKPTESKVMYKSPTVNVLDTPASIRPTESKITPKALSLNISPSVRDPPLTPMSMKLIDTTRLSEPDSVAKDGIQRSETTVNISNPKLLRGIIWRSAIFVVVLLVGWIPAAITSIYELSIGPATEELVTAVGVAGVTHSILVPLVYAYTRKHLTCDSCFMCHPQNSVVGFSISRESDHDSLSPAHDIEKEGDQSVLND